ncbi:hypothetical protein QBC39DRAFT_435649 [Podospora conica]|nr:hypothetical protein QBC39DRAFT_435649 [Schizothecium conicum]
MAPHLPRPSTLRGLLTATTPRATPATTRTVVTIPPESPHYIYVPEPKQGNNTPLPRIRGHLPVPREIFPHRTSGPRLTSPEHIRKTMPHPKTLLSDNVPRLLRTKLQKQRDAESRRTALKEGLAGLWERRQAADARATRLSRAKGESNRRAALAPDAQDDVLTRASVRMSTAVTTKVIIDPLRMEKAEAARAKHAAIVAAKAEARRDALAQLYVAASEFIVDEAELNERVARLFDPAHHANKQANLGQSIWQAQGMPISVIEKRRDEGDLNKWTPGMTSSKAAASLRDTVKRQKKVAEELTGGRL